MTETNLRIFLVPSGIEVPFPDNSGTFISTNLRRISDGTQIVRDVNANLRDLSNPLFNKWALSLSCTDNRHPPIAGLKAGDVVDVEMPTYISEVGSVPSRTAVSGTVRVEAGFVTYRPRFRMMVMSSPDLGNTEYRGAAASWAFDLEEVNGVLDVPVGADRVVFSPTFLPPMGLGEYVSLVLDGLVTTDPADLDVAFSVVGGSLPSGLSLNPATGVVSGTTIVDGVFEFIVRAQAASGASDDQLFSLRVRTPTISLGSAELQAFTVGTPVSFDIGFLTDVGDAPVGASVSYSVADGSLPPGLTLDAATGEVAGTPTATGAYAFTVEALLSTGQSAVQSYAFYSAPASADPDPWAVLSGGTTQSWTDQGIDFQAQDFVASGTLTVLTAGYVRVVLQGGGAGGGPSTTGAGSGGGAPGEHFDRKVWLAAGTYAVSVAASAGSGSQGNITSITPISAPGGPTIQALGGGRGGTHNQAGAAGGSGGGGGGGTAGGAGGAASNAVFGTAGAAGNTSATVTLQIGGGAGGFSSPGLPGANGRGHGGGGIRLPLWSVLDLAGGGGGGSPNGAFAAGAGMNGGGNGGGSNAAGVAATANTGSGGGGAGGGPSGTRLGGAGASGRAIFIVEV